MIDDLPTSGAMRPNPRLIIGAVIFAVAAIALLAFAITSRTSAPAGLLPLLATPTPANQANSESAIFVSFSELNSDPLTYLNQSIQVTGEYFPLEQPPCPRYSGPKVKWGLVSEALQLEVKGFDRVVRILEPGTEMTVKGLWQLYQGPLGCGKGPPAGSTWFLQVQQIIHPNPLIGNLKDAPLKIEIGESGLPSLLPTATPTITPTGTPTLTATPTATTELTVPTLTIAATITLEMTPDLTATTAPTLTPLTITNTPDPSQPTPTPGPSPTSTATRDPNAGGPTATSTSDLPSLPTATNSPGGYPGDATATATIDPYP